MQDRAVKSSDRTFRATGPRSARGKAISSQNAIKHGYTGGKLFVAEEDKEEFANFRLHLELAIAPEDAHEREHFERMLRALWNIYRIDREIEKLARYRRVNVKERKEALNQITALRAGHPEPPDA